MINDPSRKLVYVPWWRPVPMARWNEGRTGFDFIGWVWRQKALLTKNLNHGWIAFEDLQTPENLSACPCCGKTRSQA